MLQLISMSISIFVLSIHARQTAHKEKFDKHDFFIFQIFISIFLVSVLSFIFKLEN